MQKSPKTFTLPTRHYHNKESPKSLWGCNTPAKYTEKRKPPNQVYNVNLPDDKRQVTLDQQVPETL